MIQTKKKIIILILLIPSFFLNYFTLTFFDINNKLSTFSTITILSFNIINLIFVYIYYKFNFKILFYFISYCILIFIIFDFSLEKIFNSNSIIKDDNKLGWILKKNMSIKFNQQTSHGKYYEVNFKSSNIDGFREFGDINKKNKFLIIGDSYTAGPYSSNGKMYYDYIKNSLDKNKFNYEIFVMGAAGYSNAQQLILLKRYFKIIKPKIVLHQFCINDFFDNNKDIRKLSTTQNQYFRSPYYNNGNIKKVEGFVPSIYRFLFKHSYMFKKLDQIYTYRNLVKIGRFKSEINNQMITSSINTTRDILKEFRKIIGEETILFSVNCADIKNNYLSKYWIEIVNQINGFAIEKPSNKIIELNNKDIDVFHEDGGHLNDYGNKIYGKLISDEIIKKLSNL